MKTHTNSRRGRNRGNGKRHIPLRSQTFESSGPDGKIRGTAQQVFDRYLLLARDAYSSGDPITAESFYQHAEHYYRLLNIEGPDGERGPSRPRPPETAETQPESDPLQAPGGESTEEATARLPI